MMRTLIAAALVVASVPALANEANDRITASMIKNLKPDERLNVNCRGDTCNYDIRKEPHSVYPGTDGVNNPAVIKDPHNVVAKDPYPGTGGVNNPAVTKRPFDNTAAAKLRQLGF